MKVLLSWLNEYGDFADPTDDDAVQRLADTMTALGLAVEDIDRVGATVDGVVSARVLRLEQHPDAAKVQRVYVDAGDGSERHVWCGAFNMQVGDVVPLATLGTTMPNGMTIERRGILGIDSEGMLCAADELGLGTDHSGILILPADTELGVPYGEVLGIRPDVLFDLDLTRNRPDCWGYVGIARDVAAQMGIEFRPPTPPEPEWGPERTAPVELVSGDRCGRFTSVVMSGVEVGPSPDWMQRRLLAAGMRPISNVVDASNYVTLELNQPTHAYDLETLGGGGFRIRVASEGEQMVTLDGETRTLTEADVLICDADDVPIGIGGVMGGLDSEISDTTTVVAHEIAWFTPLTVLQTSSRLGLRTEASARYERGCDPYIIDTAHARFAELLGETCPNLVVHAGKADERGPGLPPQERSTELRISEVNRVLGTELTADDLPPLLDPIGFTVSGSGDTRTVAIPSWRPDSTEEIDVIEEVARHYGYERVGKTVPKSTVHGALSVKQQRRRLLREVLLGLGISEAMPNPFLAPDTLAKAGLDGPTISITNPLVVEESVLRTSLRPGLLEAIAYNESHRATGVKLFEIGHVYPPGSGELPDEYEALCVVLAGEEAPAAMAVWREIATALGVGARVDQGRVPAGLHATRSATLQAGKDPTGAVGEVDPAVLQRFEVTERVAILELDLDEVLGREPKPAQWKPVSKYPSSDLDLAFILSDDVPAEKLEKAIRQGAGALLVDIELFDVFRGESLGDGRRSLAYRVRLQADDRNLTDADIAEVRRGAVAAATKLGAELRG
ncbi:phenylalanyl-tRNA synthetase beta subunit [Ilumatobacter fluminis]|uniref:Phenylalanine--tRNA ligase beta subunit n=1 Tax=Ilumatobacter fluminis TaxID=467091 RepID=A0A4R7I198_9ACTN|nr:phenylalanine--tRNA ligase subunit beta [Ilumatobacter fluminis]TDT16356.1 phenylalanyl-tRNA synthetase beta subunit [Ilumatobacter fluminis]